MSTKTFIAALVVAAMVGFGATTVPLPFLLLEPGPTREATELFALQEFEQSQVSGQFVVTTVVPTRPTLVRLFRGLLASDESVRPAPSVRSRSDEDLRQGLEEFHRSIVVGVGIGLEAAGREVTFHGDGVEVSDVVEGGPAEGRLHEGDVIVGLNGYRVRSVRDLDRALRDASASGDLALRVRGPSPDGERGVRLEGLDADDGGHIGFHAETKNLRVDMPDVTVTEQRTVGGSSGLLVALASFDLAMSDVDVVRGRKVSATGGIDEAGGVTEVGGVPEKVWSASRHGADMFLVPGPQLEEACSVARSLDLPVVPVAHFGQAVAALAAERVTDACDTAG